MNVTIHLTRCEHSDSDDVISIRRRQTSGFLVRFVDGTVPNRVWVSEKSINEVMDYLERILLGLHDIDPFIGIQFDFPGYPQVYQKISELTPAIHQRFLEMMRDWLISPPSLFFQ